MLEFTLDNERARPVVDYETKYAVTESGRIASFRKDGSYKFLSLHQNKKGYLKIKLSKNCKQVTKKIHRLVAEAFLEPNIDKLHIYHIDGDKTNNHYTNLKWCTQKENTEYYFANKANMTLHEWRTLKQNQAIDSSFKQIQRISNRLVKIVNKKYKLKHTIVGYKCKVNGIEFSTAGSAAKYIIEQELKNNRARNKATISKEIRRMLSGKRKGSLMYKKYRIEPVS